MTNTGIGDCILKVSIIPFQPWVTVWLALVYLYHEIGPWLVYKSPELSTVARGWGLKSNFRRHEPLSVWQDFKTVISLRYGFILNLIAVCCAWVGYCQYRKLMTIINVREFWPNIACYCCTIAGRAWNGVTAPHPSLESIWKSGRGQYSRLSSSRSLPMILLALIISERELTLFCMLTIFCWFRTRYV